VPFAPKTPPAREVLTESRTLKGAGRRGVATVGAAGVRGCTGYPPEAQGRCLAFGATPRHTALLFIALGLGGIAVGGLGADPMIGNGGQPVMWGQFAHRALARTLGPPGAPDAGVAAFALRSTHPSPCFISTSEVQVSGRAAPRVTGKPGAYPCIHVRCWTRASRSPFGIALIFLTACAKVGSDGSPLVHVVGGGV